MISHCSIFITSHRLRQPPLAGKSSLPRCSPSVRFRPARVSTKGACACPCPPPLDLDLPSSSSSSLYDVLGISMGATGEETKSAYRKLARTLHPDVAAIDRKDSSADEFMRVHAAYTTLSDPEKRADYDRSLFRFRRSYPGVSVSLDPLYSRFSGYAGRKWETDQCW